MPKFTFGQVAAFGRHIVSYSMGVVTALAALHIIDAAGAKTAASAIAQIGSGIAQITAAVAALISVLSGLYAGWIASPLSQLIAVAKNPAVKRVVTTPSVANAVSHDKVVAD